jgi:hypothetical protein
MVNGLATAHIAAIHHLGRVAGLEEVVEMSDLPQEGVGHGTG